MKASKQSPSPAPVTPSPAPTPSPSAPTPAPAPSPMKGLVDMTEHMFHTVAGLVGIKQETNKKAQTMTFSVGEGMSDSQRQAAYDTINKLVTPLPEVTDPSKVPLKEPITIKMPGLDAGLQNVPDNMVDQLGKGLIEWPETVARSVVQEYQQLTSGTYKPTPETTFTGGASGVGGILDLRKQMDDYISQNTNLTPLQSTWVAALYTGSAGMLDLVGLGDLLRGGVRAVAQKTALSGEQVSTAKALLGNPADLAHAETQYKNLQKLVHPDVGGSAKLSAQANDAIKILRAADKEGLMGKVARTAQQLDRPLGDLFSGKKTAPITPEMKALPASGEGETAAKTGDITPPEPAKKEPQPYKPSTSGGFVDPGAISESAGKAITSTKQFLDETKKVGKLGKTVGDIYYNKVGAAEADKINARKYVMNSQMTSQQAEHIDAHMDDPSVKLSPDEQAIYDKEIAPLRKEIDAIYREIRSKQGYAPPAESAPGVPGYNPRFVKGKGSAMDVLSQGAEAIKESLQGVGKGPKSLSKSAPQLKKRTLYRLVNTKTGKRTIASIKGGKLTEFENKKANPMGKVAQKTKEQFLKKEVKPLESKIKRVQKFIDTLSSVKVREPVSGDKLAKLKTKIEALKKYAADRAADNKGFPEIYKSMNKDIEKTKSIIDDLETRVKALKKFGNDPKVAAEIEKLNQDIADAYDREMNLSLSDVYEHVSEVAMKDEDLDAKTTKELQKTAEEFRILSKVPTGDKVVRTATRIANAKRKLIKLVNQVADVEAQYDPNEMNQKVFEGKKAVTDPKNGKTTFKKDGNRYRVEPATKAEIEQHTDVQYHKHALANQLTAWIQLREVQRNMEVLDAMKNMPEFENFTMKQDTGTPPAGWRTTTVPQFRGLFLEPDFAKAIEYYYLPHPSDTGLVDKLFKMGEAVNHTIRTWNLLNPIIHPKNVAYNYTVYRGLSAMLPGMGGYQRLAELTPMAWKAVMEQSPEFLDMLRNGAAFQSHKNEVKELNEMVAKKMADELTTPSDISGKIAEALGYKTPADLAKILSHVSEAATWVSNDLFLYMAIKEEMMKGMEMSAAIQKVQRIIPDYRLTPNIPKWLGNGNLVMFAPYHIGLLKAYKNMIGDLVMPGKTAAERVQAADQLAAIGMWHFVVIPMMTALAVEETKNKHAYVAEPGMGAIVDNTQKLLQGNKTPAQWLTSVITPAYGTWAALQLAVNRNFFTGQEIYDYLDPQGAKGIAGDVGAFAEQSVQPATALQSLMNAPTETAQKQAASDFLAMLGVYSPKTTPNEQKLMHTVYEEKTKYTTESTAKFEAGDIKGGVDIINAYNSEVVQYFKKSLEDEGIPPVTDAQAIILMKTHLIAMPKVANIQKKINQKGETSFQKLLPQK